MSRCIKPVTEWLLSLKALGFVIAARWAAAPPQRSASYADTQGEPCCPSESFLWIPKQTGTGRSGCGHMHFVAYGCRMSK
mmetsp:Transcript_2387/g.4515  ORF Transcript_2387/g.4515 Transcript_2387/m.4515 type:complete len:80 (-) Transcript_2387:56-295(-)